MPRSIPMTFDMHDPFKRRFRWAGPNAAPARIPDPDLLTAPCGPGVGRLYRFRVFCAASRRAGRRAAFFGRKRRMIAVNGFEIHKGWLDAGGAGGDGRRHRRRRRGRAVLRAAHALGQADERADDLRRPLRLVHRRARATATSTATPPAAPWPPIPAERARGLARAGLARRATPTAASSTTTAPPRAWACTATPTRPTSPGRCSRSASATRRSSAWAAPARKDPTASILLESGDVVVLRRPRAPRLPRHRPHPLRRLAPAARGRAHQPDLPGGRLTGDQVQTIRAPSARSGRASRAARRRRPRGSGGRTG